VSGIPQGEYVAVHELAPPTRGQGTLSTNNNNDEGDDTADAQE
jgi:hypothetical protein